MLYLVHELEYGIIRGALSPNRGTYNSVAWKTLVLLIINKNDIVLHCGTSSQCSWQIQDQAHIHRLKKRSNVLLSPRKKPV